MTINSKCSKTLVFSLLASLFLFAGCMGEDEKKEAASQGPTPMKVIEVETKDMPYWGEFIGQISAVDTVDVRARVAGFLLTKNFSEGSAVKKGDLLFVIDPKTYNEDLKQAQSGMEYNQALMIKAQKDMERFKKLYDEGVVSRDEYEGYLTDFNTYSARVRENKAQVENARIQLGYTKVYSPIDGVIGRVQVDIGNLVGQNESTLLATVSTVDPVYVSFSVSESDYIRAQRSKEERAEYQKNRKQIKMILADGTEYEYGGEFSMIDRAVDPQTGTLGIRVSFPNPDELLRPGQYAKVRVLIDSVEDAVVVPTRGVQDVQGMKSIYKVGPDGKLVNQPIKIGFEVGELVVVREGLKKGDKVVIDGVRRVRPGMEIKPIVVPMQKKQGEAVPMGNDAKPAEQGKEG